MGILPKILSNENNSNNIINNLNTLNQGLKTYIIDFKSKKMRYENGKMVVDNLELATKMYIQKLFYTEIKKWLYHQNYGTNYVSETLSKRYSRIIHRVNIESNIREQLLKYPNIVAVNKLEIKQTFKTLNISFNVILKDKNIIEWKEEIVL